MSIITNHLDGLNTTVTGNTWWDGGTVGGMILPRMQTYYKPEQEYEFKVRQVENGFICVHNGKELVFNDISSITKYLETVFKPNENK